MYTKIFLLILVLNIIPQKVSNGNMSRVLPINGKNCLIIRDANSINNSNSTDEKSGTTGSDWSDIGQHLQDQHNSEDDGKSHYVHFERYLRRRNKNLYCVTCKIILLLSYLCSLVASYYHLVH